MDKSKLSVLTCAVYLACAGALRAGDYLDESGSYPVVAVDAVHEAVQREPAGEASQWAPFQPPAPLDESRRRGRNPSGSATWVEGYWRWTPGQARFLWVPGCWREPPPGLIWHTGHWERAGDRWLWVPGHWGPKRRHRLHRTERRPPSNRPNGPNPPNRPGWVWIPGSWRFNGRRFVWVNGEWRRPPQQHMEWVSGSWVEQNGHYVYLPGRWDYARTARIHRYVPGSVSPGHRVHPPPLAGPAIEGDRERTAVGGFPSHPERMEARGAAESVERSEAVEAVEAGQRQPNRGNTGRTQAGRPTRFREERRPPNRPGRPEGEAVRPPHGGRRVVSSQGPSGVRRDRPGRGRFLPPQPAEEEDPTDQPVRGSVSR